MSSEPVALGSVAEFVRGITFKPEDVVASGAAGAVDCMRTKNVQATLDQDDVWAVPVGFVRRPDQFLAQGDILVSSANSWNLVGKCCWIPELPRRSTFGGFVSVLRAKPGKVDPRFLYRWFSSERIQTTARSFGQQTTNISNLNIDRCLALELPLPPLPEQERIARILDAADALRAKRRAAIAELDALPQAIFQEMFGSVSRNPRNLQKSRLGELLKLKSGAFLPASAMADGGSFPVFGGNGINGAHNVFLFAEPRVVIGRVGAYCGVVHMTPAQSWVTDNALYVDELAETLDLPYLAQALTLAHLNQYASQSGQPLVSASRLYPVEILLPPLALQHEFAARVAAVDRLKSAHRASLAELDALFASLQHRAFRGEL